MMASCRAVLSPAGSKFLLSASSNCCSPPTRTMKNSSRFEPVIARNFRRSMSGTAGSIASCSTRRLNSSQLNSRLKNSGSRLRMARSPAGAQRDRHAVHFLEHVALFLERETFERAVLRGAYRDDELAFLPGKARRTQLPEMGAFQRVGNAQDRGHFRDRDTAVAIERLKLLMIQIGRASCRER